jgi:hypothetical protein
MICVLVSKSYGFRLKAERALLATYSDYFATLCGSQFADAEEMEVLLPDWCEKRVIAWLLQILRLIMTGHPFEIRDSSEAWDVLKLADYLQIQDQTLSTLFEGIDVPTVEKL